jgi:hypothetical protein
MTQLQLTRPDQELVSGARVVNRIVANKYPALRWIIDVLERIPGCVMVEQRIYLLIAGNRARISRVTGIRCSDPRE